MEVPQAALDAIRRAEQEGRVVEHGKEGPREAPGGAAWSEKEFQARVVAKAKENGWALVYHALNSRGSAGGFPDLVLARGPDHAVRLVVAELKVGGNKPTPQQHAWLAALRGAGVLAFCWRPEDWNTIARLLEAP